MTLYSIIVLAALIAVTLGEIGNEAMGSATPHTVIANGNAQISTAQFKFGGASGIFDGTNSYLSTGASSDFDFGTGDWTVDFWIYLNGNQADYSGIVSAGAAGPLAGWILDASYAPFSNTLRVVSKASGAWAEDLRANGAISTGTWTHVAVVRFGNMLTIYYNGVSKGSATVSGYAYNSAAMGLDVGREYTNSPGGYFNGWIDELRVTKGLARWTSNFTPPSAAYVSDSQTVLLLHMDGSSGSTTFTDSSAVTGPDFSITPSPGSQSIGAGGSALSTLTLTALGGYIDLVDLVITSGCSATGMICTLNGGSTASVPAGSGTVTLAVNTQVNTPPAAYPVVVTGTDHVNSAITHQATFTVTVGAATSYQFNVKGTATQIVVTLTYSWTDSGTPPQGSVTISSPSGVCSSSCLEAAGAVYDRTSIAVSNAGNTYSIIHRVTFTITAPGAMPAWTAYVTLSGVSTYTVTIEVS